MSIKVGDLVLFEGPSIFAKFIQCMSYCKYREHAKYNHSAIVYDVNGDEITICHSVKEGVVKESLNAIASQKYYHRIIILPTTEPIGASIIQKECDKYIGTGYEINVCECFGALWDCCECCKNTKNLKYFFCSEFVAQVYIDSGMFKSTETSNEYVPQQFLEMEKMFNTSNQISMNVPPTNCCDNLRNFCIC